MSKGNEKGNKEKNAGGKNEKKAPKNNPSVSSKESSHVETAPPPGKQRAKGPGSDSGGMPILVDNKIYAKELSRLQVELVKLQEWVRLRLEGGGHFRRP